MLRYLARFGLAKIQCPASPSRTLGGLLSQQVRFSSGSDPCKKEPEKPKCGPPSLKKNPCGKSKTPEKKPEPKKEEAVKPKPKFVSMWDIKDCPERPVDCELPFRFDVKYYRISDKSKRKYQVTWNECPRLLVKPKKVCLFQKVKPVERCRRKRLSLTAKKPCATVKPMKCQKDSMKGKCPRFVLPCCKPARNPPVCKGARVKAKCTKLKTPYPSYSECKKDPLDDLPPTECRCLEAGSACEAWAVLRRRLARGQDSVKCGTP